MAKMSSINNCCWLLVVSCWLLVVCREVFLLKAVQGQVETETPNHQ